MSAVVYTQPGCAPCTATVRAMDRRGLSYVEVDLTARPGEISRLRALGHTRTPIVITADGDTWAGFRPDKIAALAQAGHNNK